MERGIFGKRVFYHDKRLGSVYHFPRQHILDPLYADVSGRALLRAFLRIPESISGDINAITFPSPFLLN